MGDLEESIWLMHLKRVTMHHQHRVKCRNCSVQEEWVSISTLLASCYIYFANFPIAGWAKIGIWWHERYSHGSHFTGAPPRFSGNESGGDPQLRASMEGLDWFCPPYWFGPAQQWSTTTRRWTVSASSQPGMYVLKKPDLTDYSLWPPQPSCSRHLAPLIIKLVVVRRVNRRRLMLLLWPDADQQSLLLLSCASSRYTFFVKS